MPLSSKKQTDLRSQSRPGRGSTARIMQRRLRLFSNPEKARVLRRFFKTGPGEYGEGDRFLGVMVPNIRKIVRFHQDAPLAELAKLLRSPWHEERLLALLILVRQYERGDDARRAAIYSLYLGNTRFINNWDLVDLTAPNIVGAHLLDKSRKPLFALARSRDLWKRRIAIMSTFHFIKSYDYADTLAISELLLYDKEDLIHKAVGWMLRETGKRALKTEERFLKRHYKSMPRTMLRYAIEKFPQSERRKYLDGKA